MTFTFANSLEFSAQIPTVTPVLSLIESRYDH